MTKFNVQYTASVYNPDTEESFNGWVDLRWNRYQLRSESTDVTTDTFDTLAEALADIDSTIGTVRDNGDGTYYAEDTDANMESGEDWSYAAHVTEVTAPLTGLFKTYRAKELAGVKLGDGPDDDSFYRLKVTGKSGDTKHLNITPLELERIIEALEPDDYRQATL